MRILILFIILLALLAGSYFHYRIDQLRAETDALYTQVQDMEAKFIRNKMMMFEGKWRGKK